VRRLVSACRAGGGSDNFTGGLFRNH